MHCGFLAVYDKIVGRECLKRSECSDFWISCNVYPLRALIKESMLKADITWRYCLHRRRTLNQYYGKFMKWIECERQAETIMLHHRYYLKLSLIRNVFVVINFTVLVANSCLFVWMRLLAVDITNKPQKTSAAINHRTASSIEGIVIRWLRRFRSHI